MVHNGNRVHAFGWSLSWQHTINHYGYQDWECTALAGEELEGYLKKPWSLSKKEKRTLEVAIMTEYDIPMKNVFFRLLTK